MIRYDVALAMVLETVAPLPAVGCPLTEAAGLVLAAPVAAGWDMPRADNSAMDGFTLSAAAATGPLPVIGTAYAGHPFAGEVAPGSAVRITTGAPLPAGCDTVVPVEETSEANGSVTLRTSPAPGDHVRCRGEEYRAGETLLDAGSMLRAGEIGLLASAGAVCVTVYPRPRVALLTTGDELVELGEEPGPGQIVNSNRHQLAARLRECGCEVIALGLGRDEPGGIDALLDASRQADLLISTGGVSVGERDLVRETLEHHGFRKIFWKVAIKPGKPVLFGTLDGKPCFGLPGNPAAAAATFELFVLPALRRMAGQASPRAATAHRTRQDPLARGGNRQAFLWCRLEWGGDGYRVHVSKRQGSGQHRSLQGANALLAVPVGAEMLPAGALVEVLLLG